MDNLKTITAREIKQITETFCEKPKVIMWHGKRICVNPLLSFKETFELVSVILASCANDDGKPIPESLDFNFKVEVLNKYCGINLPTGIEDAYKVIYSTDLFESIISNVNQKQIKSIVQIIKNYTGMEILLT